MAEASRRPREEQIGEHDYARAPQFTWPGEVVFGEGADAHVVRGTWNLEWSPRALVRPGAAAVSMPAIGDAAWVARVERLMTLGEPGLQLRIGQSDAEGWQTLEVTAPTRPTTVIEFDRAAMARVGGVSSIALRVLV